MPTLNLAGHSDTAGTPSLAGSEADLEKRLAGANPAERARLMKGLGLVRLDRQVPVGVFDGPPSRAGFIFTGGNSAIDLVGLGGGGSLWLLELKAARNIKVGALSELFFYSMMLHGARHGRISFHNKPAGVRSTISPTDIVNAPRIHARLLAEASHQLVTAAGPSITAITTSGAIWTTSNNSSSDFTMAKVMALLARIPFGRGATNGVRLATDQPDLMSISPRLLGHVSPDTGQKHYNHARMLDAGKRFAANVSELREGFLSPAELRRSRRLATIDFPLPRFEVDFINLPVQRQLVADK